jgi:hypothetical protein
MADGGSVAISAQDYASLQTLLFIALMIAVVWAVVFPFKQPKPPDKSKPK